MALPTKQCTASDAATIERRLGSSIPAARLLTAELRRGQRTFARSATVAGLAPPCQQDARGAARAVSVVTARLLLIPTSANADLALKLTMLIAVGEPGPDEARAYPCLYLCALLADLRRPDRLESCFRR